MKFYLLFIFFSTVLFADFPITCEGKTHITYHHPIKEQNFVITCYEPVQLDCNLHNLRCLNSHPTPQKQIHFQDGIRDLYSDQLELSYTHIDNKILLDKLKIYGNVYLMQERSLKKEESDPEYAHADQLDYDYRHEKVILSANSGRRVTYYDPSNNTHLSAPKILIDHSISTSKPRIQSIGDTSILFDPKDFKDLKDHFSLKSKETL